MRSNAPLMIHAVVEYARLYEAAVLLVRVDGYHSAAPALEQPRVKVR